MAIDTSNISFINYLWTKKNGDGTLTGIRLSKDNLPEYLADPIPILAGKNISITPTNAGIEISAAADGKVKTVNNQQPDSNGNVQLTAANVSALANNASVVYYITQSLTDAQKAQARTNIGAGTSSFTGYTSSNKLHTDYINNAAGWTSNKGTVTSVRVQAGTGLSSSQNTAQTNTLNTTISIASGYKLPTTTEWADIPSISGAYSISAGNGIVLTPNESSLEISVSSTSSVTSGSTALVTSGAVYSAIQSAITTALNTSV